MQLHLIINAQKSAINLKIFIHQHGYTEAKEKQNKYKESLWKIT